ncbi:LOW QUALITY PROTEIN: hypothetical protein ACHAXS_008500 [Conticribra weissflogii]
MTRSLSFCCNEYSSSLSILQRTYISLFLIPLPSSKYLVNPKPYSLNQFRKDGSLPMIIILICKPNDLRKGTITKGIVTPITARVQEKAMMGWRWMRDLNHPFPRTPCVTPTAPPMVDTMASS